MPIGDQVAVVGQSLEGLALPDRVRPVDEAEHRRVGDEEAAVDEAAVAGRLFLEAADEVTFELESAEPARRRDRGDGRLLAMTFVEGDQLADVDRRDAVAVGEAEGLVVVQVGSTAFSRPPVIVSAPVSTRVIRQGSLRFWWISVWFLLRSMVTSAVCRK